MVPGTVNTRRGAAVLHDTTMASAPVANKNSFEDMLAEEANFTASCQPKHVTFLDMMGGVLPHPHPINTRKRWSYHQDSPNITTPRKLGFMWLPTNLGRCGSPKLVN